jgi:signal transduction histidine kinase
MNSPRANGRAPVVLAALGAVAFLVAVVHHLGELRTLGESLGPLAAFLLDGGLALALVYAGYALARSDLGAKERRSAVAWSLGGAVVFTAVVGATVLVRLFEGRVITEPVFPLLVAAESGALAGAVAGYYSARARRDARRARRVNEALEFVNSLIRHDLRNDLNVIRGYAELAAEGADERDNASVVVSKSEEALTRIETTREVTGTLVGEPDFEAVDLVPVAEEMAARVEESFGVTVALDTAERAPVTANDGVRSVVDNLLENAAEHNDAAEPVVGVEIETGEDTVRLTVRDNGPGITEEERERLLEASGTEASGTVLTRTLVREYGGDVWIEDAEPRGTAFVVELPRAEE